MSAPLPKFDLAERESLDSELTRKLLDYLLSGSLDPGQRLPSERALAQRLGVGRHAIRNALTSLAMLGLVKTRIGSATYFRGRQSDLLPRVIEWGVLLSQDWVTDLIDARRHLEILFAGLAAERRTEENLIELRSILDDMRSSAHDYSAYAEADTRFHLAIARASCNNVLAGVLTNIRRLVTIWSVRVITTAGETETSIPKHETVLRAIEKQDIEAARKAMKSHMDRAERRLRQSVSPTVEARRTPEPQIMSHRQSGSATTPLKSQHKRTRRR